MKFKDFLFILIYIIIFYMAFISKNHSLSIIGISIILIDFIYTLISSTLKWNKNKKEINSEYTKLKVESYLIELLALFNIYLKMKRQYKSRAFYLEYFHNEKVIINNFTDFINTFDIMEKILIYLIIGFSIVFVISIIKKVICSGMISSDKVLLSDGELINLKDIKNIKIENSFWEFSKKISFELDKVSKIIYIKNTPFTKIEESLTALVNDK
ncbi:hypothetical protein [Clostridium sp.]|uniref:hypothetical protein n=1 Tax=Clostridium sp. TaxID=1506 RepID=UPI002910098B|nr:hypothetical protein [Clostridium sp.]MDU5105730.1 hypothetical protein [Clostridium sp.]